MIRLIAGALSVCGRLAPGPGRSSRGSQPDDRGRREPWAFGGNFTGNIAGRERGFVVCDMPAIPLYPGGQCG